MIYYCLVKSSRKYTNSTKIKLSIHASHLIAHAQYQNKRINVKLLRPIGVPAHRMRPNSIKNSYTEPDVIFTEKRGKIARSLLPGIRRGSGKTRRSCQWGAASCFCCHSQELQGCSLQIWATKCHTHTIRRSKPMTTLCGLW